MGADVYRGRGDTPAETYQAEQNRKQYEDFNEPLRRTWWRRLFRRPLVRHHAGMAESVGITPYDIARAAAYLHDDKEFDGRMVDVPSAERAEDWGTERDARA